MNQTYWIIHLTTINKSSKIKQTTDNKFTLFAAFITICVIIFIGCVIVHNVNAKNEREQALIEDSICVDEPKHALQNYIRHKSKTPEIVYKE